MKSMHFDLAQVLAVAWVWQREIYPRFFHLKSKNDIRPGKVRKKELYTAAYNQLLKDLFSDTADVYSISVQRPAMSLFAEHTSAVLEFFRMSLCIPGSFSWHGTGNSKLEYISLEEVILREYLQPPTPKDLRKAKRDLKKLLSIHPSGELVFNPVTTRIIYSSLDKFQQLSIRERVTDENLPAAN